MDNFLDKIIDYNKSQYISKATKIREIVAPEVWINDPYYCGEDGKFLYPFWKKHFIEIFSRPNEKRINEIIITGSLGCLELGTKYQTSKGLLTLEEISKVSDDLYVMTEYGKKRIINSHFVGLREAKRITFSDGSILCGTLDHKIKNSKGEFVEFDSIKVGDVFVKKMNDTNIFGNNTSIDIDEAYLLGYLFGDGYLIHNTSKKDDSKSCFCLAVGCTSFELSDFLFNLYSKYLGNTTKIFDKRSKTGLYTLRANNQEKAALYKELGYGSDNKCFPSALLGASEEIICSFLQGLFDSDGYCCRGDFGITLNSKDLIYDIQQILYSLGIKNKISRKGKAYRLYIYSGKYAKRFYDKISFRLSYKREQLERLLAKDASSNSDIMYGYSNILKEYYNSNPLVLDRKHNHLRVWNKNQEMTRRTLDSLRDYNQDWFEGLVSNNFIYNNDCTFVKVVSIEDCKVECGDIEVEDVHEYIINGFFSHNTGKTTFMTFCFLRLLYELSCYDCPQILYNLMSSTSIVLMYLSINREIAENTGYGDLRQRIDTIPYFIENFPRNQRLSNDIEFPQNNIRVGSGSRASHAIGTNLIAAALDESNFKGTGEAATDVNSMSKAQQVYNALRRRGENRFTVGGIDYSLSILLSSATTSNSFTEARIAHTASNEHVYHINAKVYEVKPAGTYSDEKFVVFMGNDQLDPTLVETVPALNNIMDSVGLPRFADTVNLVDSINSLREDIRAMFELVPMNFIESFRTDVVKSLQDICGVPVNPIGRLFTAKRYYNECIDNQVTHPFIQDEFILSTGSSVTGIEYLRSDWKPLEPHKTRFVHIDQSTASDKTGICMGFIDHFENINGENKPVIYVDFMLAINPPLAPEKIHIAKCRQLVLDIAKKFNLKIGKFTYDTFASQESVQQLQQEGINADFQSVDRTVDAYLELCDLFYEKRIHIYSYPKFEKEFFNLQYYRDRKKIDHLPEFCFTGDTKVALVDGRSLSFEELLLEQEYKDNWVYTMTDKGIRPRKIKKVWQTMISKDLVEVTLDNGESIVCTANHRFMLRNGEFKEAGYLELGTALMPLYTNKNHKVVSVRFLDEYQKVYDLEVDGEPNFALAAGVFVHNSKDVSDAVAGMIHNAAHQDAQLDALRKADAENILKWL